MNEKEREAKRELNNCWKDAAVLLLLLLLLLKPYTIRCASVCMETLHQLLQMHEHTLGIKHK